MSDNVSHFWRKPTLFYPSPFHYNILPSKYDTLSPFRHGNNWMYKCNNFLGCTLTVLLLSIVYFIDLWRSTKSPLVMILTFKTVIPFRTLQTVFQSSLVGIGTGRTQCRLVTTSRAVMSFRADIPWSCLIPWQMTGCIKITTGPCSVNSVLTVITWWWKDIVTTIFRLNTRLQFIQDIHLWISILSTGLQE